MTAPTPPRRATTTATDRDRMSRTLPVRDFDQSLLWKDVRQGALFITLFVAIGVGAVWFMALPRPAQAMIVYGACVSGCVALILAGLRRRKHGR